MIPYFHSATYQPLPANIEAFDKMQKMRKGTLEGQLSGIRDILNQNSAFQDSLTNLIRQWYADFSHYVRSPASIEQTEEGYIELLQQILIDPLTQTPLDVEAHLGSDGYTYSHHSLCLYLNAVPNEHKDRSPMNQTLDEPFYTTPHLVARFLVEWLIRFDLYPLSPKLENNQRAFLDLEANNRVPLIPTQENRKIRILIQAQIERRQRMQAQAKAKAEAIAKEQLAAQARALIKEQEQAQLQDQVQAQALLAEVVELDRNLLEEIQNTADQVFGAIEAHIQERGKRQFARMDAMEQKNQEQLQNLQQEIENLKAQEKDLEDQNQELEKSLNKLGNSLSEAERANMRLQISLNETRMALNKRNSSALSGILSGIAIIGVVVLTTWAMGGAGMVTPIADGGAKMIFVYPL